MWKWAPIRRQAKERWKSNNLPFNTVHFSWIFRQAKAFRNFHLKFLQHFTDLKTKPTLPEIQTKSLNKTIDDFLTAGPPSFPSLINIQNKFLMAMGVNTSKGPNPNYGFSKMDLWIENFRFAVFSSFKNSPFNWVCINKITFRIPKFSQQFIEFVLWMNQMTGKQNYIWKFQMWAVA